MENRGFVMEIGGEKKGKLDYEFKKKNKNLKTWSFKSYKLKHILTRITK